MFVGRVVFFVAAGVVVSGAAHADVHLLRRTDGSALIFNDRIGSGWRVSGGPPSDAYLVDRRAAPSAYDETIGIWSTKAGVDPSLVKSVMLVESNFDPRAVSRKGACGLMQLMPHTARRFGVRDRFDAVQSIRGGVTYLAELLSLFSGDVALALAAYNSGASAVSRYSGVPPYPETQEYVRRALIAYKGEAVPVVGGGFRGLPAKAPRAKPSAPVQIARVNGAHVLSNAGIPQRSAPLLGRVR